MVGLRCGDDAFGNVSNVSPFAFRYICDFLTLIGGIIRAKNNCHRNFATNPSALITKSGADEIVVDKQPKLGEVQSQATFDKLELSCASKLNTVVAINQTMILTLMQQHKSKVLRYCAVSVVNVVVGLTTLAVALELLLLSPLAANIVAWLVSTFPAYLMSRYWVWQQLGTNSLKSEITPFWIIALVGLVVSSLSVVALSTITNNTIVFLIGVIAAYGIVWVAKYLILDGWLWPTHSEESPSRFVE